ncbi:unnamed protein product [Adineta ricciae]|uniref:Uncharacterized protein n=1 Tax=Adineta ricciae TaxID=249248 RepID=A0A816FIS0_ADIRI|nr:unnamed protein product [Adineta ricciae]
MADEQDASNEGDPVPDYGSADDADSAAQASTAIPDEAQEATTPISNDYADEDEDLPDVTINLYINDGPGDVTVPADISQAILTDIYGNPVTQSPAIDFTTSIADIFNTEMITNETATGGKGLFGVWTWNKILFVGLIALCIIGIILALLFLIIGKKFKKNKGTQGSRSTTTTKSVVTSNVAAGGRYEPVRNV